MGFFDWLTGKRDPASTQARKMRGLALQLASPDMDVREKAARSLADLGTQEGAEILLEGLRENALGWSTRSFLPPELLAKIGAPAVAPLISALGSNSVAVRRYAAATFARMSVPEAVDALAGLLSRRSEQSDEGGAYFARVSAAEAIGAVGVRAARAADTLISALFDPDPNRRTGVMDAAEQALKAIGRDALPPVRAALADSARQLRAIEILSAWDVRDPGLGPELIAIWRLLPADQRSPSLLSMIVFNAPDFAFEALRDAIRGAPKMLAKAGDLLVDGETIPLSVREELQPVLDGTLGIKAAELKEWATRKQVSGLEQGDPILCVAHLRELAKPILPALVQALNTVMNTKVRIWLSGVAICLDGYPQPHLRQLFLVMDQADRGYVERKDPEMQREWEQNPELVEIRARTDQMFKELQHVRPQPPVNPISFAEAWAAYNPASLAKATLLRILPLVGTTIEPVLRELSATHPKRVSECINALQGVRPKDHPLEGFSAVLWG